MRLFWFRGEATSLELGAMESHEQRRGPSRPLFAILLEFCEAASLRSNQVKAASICPLSVSCELSLSLELGAKKFHEQRTTGPLLFESARRCSVIPPAMT